MTTTAPATTQKKDRPLGQSQFSVAWQQFRKNRLAQAGGLMLILLYVMAIFAPFIAPDALSSYSTSNITRFHPPTPVSFRDPETGAFGRPFVFKYTQQLTMEWMAVSFSFLTHAALRAPRAAHPLARRRQPSTAPRVPRRAYRALFQYAGKQRCCDFQRTPAFRRVALLSQCQARPCYPL